MEIRRRGFLWRVVLRSALKLRHVVLLVLSLPLFLELPVVGLLGVLIYSLLVWHDATDPIFVRSVLAEDSDENPEPPVIIGAYREQVAAVEQARVRIYGAIAEADRSMGRVIAPIKAQVDQVVERLYGLVERAQRIDAFLARQNREQIEESAAALGRDAAASADEFSREQYLQARSAREEQLRDYDELSLCLDRVRAQITNVRSTIEASEAKVMKLQAADVRVAGTVSESVTRSLQSLSQEVAGFQESIDATMALRAR